MKSSFIAYVDESGDEGFVFNADGNGSSRWFVLSAAVIRQTNDLQMVSCLKEVRAILKKEPKIPLHFVDLKHEQRVFAEEEGDLARKALHFADLKHEQRVPYIRRVGELPIRTVSVLVYKPLIAEPEKFQNTKYLLYRYATRLLLERVSWLGRDQRRPGEGDGFTEVIFSNRSNMSYEDMIARKLDLRGGGFSAVKVTRGDGGWEVIVETTGGTDRFAIAPDYKVTRR